MSVTLKSVILVLEFVIMADTEKEEKLRRKIQSGRVLSEVVETNGSHNRVIVCRQEWGAQVLHSASDKKGEEEAAKKAGNISRDVLYIRKSAKKQQGIEKEGRQLRSKVQFLVANCVNVSLIHLPVAWYGGETK